MVASPAAAQFTLVSGTVTDANGVAYANGLISFQLVPSTGSPTLSGLPYTPPTGPISLDSTGSFTVQLADNNVLLPAGTQWKFSVTSPVIALPVGNGPKLCSATITITGTSQSISPSFNACPLLVNAKVTATLFPLLAPNGSAPAPSYSFTNFSGSGMYAATNQLNFAIAGVQFLSFNSAPNQIQSPAGSAVSPAYSFTGRTGDGIWLFGDQVSVSSAGAEVAFFQSNQFTIVNSAGQFAVIDASNLASGQTFKLPALGGTLAEVLSGSVAGSTTLLAANSCGDAVTATITGATSSMVATASPQAAISAGLDWNAFVSAANTVTVQYCNVTTLGITPAAATFNIRVIQ